MQDDPESLADEVVDGLDAQRTAALGRVLEMGAAGAAALQASARDRLRLLRLARTLEQPPARPEVQGLTDRLAEALERPPTRRLRWAAAAAAAVVVLAGSALVLGRDHLAARTTFYGYETADARVLIEASESEDLDLPLDQDAALQARISRWVGRPAGAPDLRSVGFQLMGAKLLEAGDARVVGLVYRGHDEELVLCLSSDVDGLKEAPAFLSTAQVEAGFWSDGQRTYAAVRKSGQADSRRLVAQLQRLTETASASPERPA